MGFQVTPQEKYFNRKNNLINFTILPIVLGYQVQGQ